VKCKHDQSLSVNIARLCGVGEGPSITLRPYQCNSNMKQCFFAVVPPKNITICVLPASDILQWRDFCSHTEGVCVFVLIVGPFVSVMSRRVDWQPCAVRGDILIGLLFGNQLSRHCRETKGELAVLSVGLRSAGIHRPTGQPGRQPQMPSLCRQCSRMGVVY